MTKRAGAWAAFGYWAGFAGAAVSLKCWAAQQKGSLCGPVAKYASKQALLADLAAELPAGKRPRAIIIGALGRVGTGAADLCTAMDVAVTKWDMAETASGGPFPQVLQHEIFLNCILARPGSGLRTGLHQDGGAQPHRHRRHRLRPDFRLLAHQGL